MRRPGRSPQHRSSPAPPRRVAVIGYDNVQGLDLVGALDVFAAANVYAPRAAYALLVAAPARRAFRMESGARIVPDTTLDECTALDTVIVPGGSALRTDDRLRRRIAAWLAERCGDVRRVASVCTGVYALAESGLVAGRRVATHWRFADDLARRFPSLRVDADAIAVRDGRFATSAGITAGIDLALALVEEDLGGSVAGAVARELVVYLRRSGGQRQYSAALQFQNAAPDALAGVVGWIADNLHGDLSLEALADRMSISTRHVTRTFRAAFNTTPADVVESLRLDAARRHLADGPSPVEAVAASVGYRSSDAFRRAFERRFGIAPTAYRERFTGTGQHA